MRCATRARATSRIGMLCSWSRRWPLQRAASRQTRRSDGRSKMARTCSHDRRSAAHLARRAVARDPRHACGHNLIAMSNVGEFLLAAERAKDLGIGVALVGTPAEESGGGKIDLIDAGVFRDSLAVLSSHPS